MKGKKNKQKQHPRPPDNCSIELIKGLTFYRTHYFPADLVYRAKVLLDWLRVSVIKYFIAHVGPIWIPKVEKVCIKIQLCMYVCVWVCVLTHQCVASSHLQWRGCDTPLPECWEHQSCSCSWCSAESHHLLWRCHSHRYRCTCSSCCLCCSVRQWQKMRCEMRPKVKEFKKKNWVWQVKMKNKNKNLKKEDFVMHQRILMRWVPQWRAAAVCCAALNTVAACCYELSGMDANEGNKILQMDTVCGVFSNSSQFCVCPAFQMKNTKSQIVPRLQLAAAADIS